MRKGFCDAMVKRFPERPFTFLTGDLGFRALEPLQEAMGARFLNAGVAEQNMVSVAAGMALRGEQVWVYSIAPFCYARPFEQVRNDLCLHDLPVKLVGNGGGYAYGVMGASHHAIEDYGALLALQNMHCFVPAFEADVDPIVGRLADFPHPAYLRLGRGEEPAGWTAPDYAPWRRLRDGAGPVVLAVGPIAGSLLEVVESFDAERRPELWVLSELPLESHPPPAELLARLERAGRLMVVEEHVAQGSAGRALAHHLLLRGLGPVAFDHACARGYPSGTYGSQAFHRRECGLDPDALRARIEALATTA